jgi:hypothetical protein
VALALEVVADVADSVEGLAVGVGNVPVEVALAGVDRAGVTAVHRDDDVGGMHHTGGELLRVGHGESDAAFGEHREHPLVGVGEVVGQGEVVASWTGGRDCTGHRWSLRWG